MSEGYLRALGEAMMVPVAWAGAEVQSSKMLQVTEKRKSMVDKMDEFQIFPPNGNYELRYMNQNNNFSALEILNPQVKLISTYWGEKKIY